MAETQQENVAEASEEAPVLMNLKVDVSTPSACERRIVVTIPREDIDRYFDKQFSEIMPSAAVPGFRQGRAPRKLVETRFRKEVAPQVKMQVLLDSITQVNDSQKLAAISEPVFDVEAVQLPDTGPMVFEYKLEVRPEFATPQWRGLKLQRPVREFTKQDIERRKEALLAKHGHLEPKEGAAALGDYVAVDIEFLHNDKQLSHAEEEIIRIRPVLSFRDGKVSAFDKLMVGVKAGETRVGKAQLSMDAPNLELRGEEVTARFVVREVKSLKLPEVTPEILSDLGGFASEGDFLDFIKEDLERKLKYQQSQKARQQVAQLLTEAASWELPPDLLKRQAVRELERNVMEMRSSGFTDAEIRMHSNELRQNIMRSTEKLLKEHFILEKIAEEEKIEDLPEDYDREIELMAAQSGESPRRVRARLEKRGVMDVLGNQIRERKVLDLIYQHAQFVDIPFTEEHTDVEAVDQAAGGDDQESAIPEAKYDPQPQALPSEERKD